MRSLEQTPAPAAGTGFDRTEPRTKFIALFGAGTLVALVALVLGVQAYFDYAREQQIFVKQLEPVSADLQALRAREEAQLRSYRYIDRTRGTVRLPIERAMDLLEKEYAAGKVFYPGKAVPVKAPAQEGASVAAH